MNFIQVGRLIKNLRKENNLTMIDFAKRIDISQPSLSRIESGNQEVTFSLLEKICREFNISLSQFFRKLEGKTELFTFEKSEEKNINIEQELDDELNKLISSLSVEQKKGLYILLMPYVKE